MSENPKIPKGYQGTYGANNAGSKPSYAIGASAKRLFTFCPPRLYTRRNNDGNSGAGGEAARAVAYSITLRHYVTL